MSGEQFGQLKKFKLVFLGEQSGKLSCEVNEVSFYSVFIFSYSSWENITNN